MNTLQPMTRHRASQAKSPAQLRHADAEGPFIVAVDTHPIVVDRQVFEQYCSAMQTLAPLLGVLLAAIAIIGLVFYVALT